jgi:hypothetical protein
LDASATLVLPRPCWNALETFANAFEGDAVQVTTPTWDAARKDLLETCKITAPLFYNIVSVCFPAGPSPPRDPVLVHIVAVFRLILSRAREVSSVLHADVPEPPQTDVTAEYAYNPVLDGAAYCFNPDGSRVRRFRTVKKLDDGIQDGDAQDDEPIIPCTKTFAKLRGKCYVMFFMCPRHGHCWGKLSTEFAHRVGFHIINGGEGRKDVHRVVYEYLEVAPKKLYYDFACKSARCRPIMAHTPAAVSTV